MTIESNGCVFCKIINKEIPCTFVATWIDAIAIIPINPVTLGHILVLSRTHVKDFTENPEITAKIFQRSAELANIIETNAAYNLITSKGSAATQTVFHLHVHLIPRTLDDRLCLPWTDRA